MRIIYVGTMGIPAKYGGLETCVEYLSTKFVSDVNEIIVYSVYGKTNSKRKLKNYKGVKLRYLPQTGIPPVDRIIRELIPLFYHVFDGNKCIVHIYGPSLFSILWRTLGYKIVHSLDGLEWKRYSYHPFIRIVVYLGYIMGVKFSHTITVDAKFVLDWVKSLGKEAVFVPYGPKPFFPKKNVSLPYGLKDKSYYLFIGRLVPEKGVHLLIKAFKKARTEKALFILGEDPLGGKYLDYLKKLAGNERIIFGKKFFGYDLQNIMMRSFAHIRPSINNSEGINPVAVESLTYGLMILASDVPQNKEAFGNCAIYFKKNSQSSLIKAINKLEMINEKEYNSYRSRAVIRAKKEFSWNYILKQIYKIYKKLN